MESERILHKIKRFNLINLKKNIENYHWVLSVLITLVLVLTIFQVSSWSSFSILLAFYWNWILTYQEVREKADLPKNKFSFIRLIVIINKVFEKLEKTPLKSRVFIRSLSPLLFFVFILLASGRNFLLTSLIGSFIFEGAFRLNNYLRDVS